MQISRKRTTAIAIALFMMLTIAIPLIAIPTVKAGFDNPTATAVAAGMHWPPPGPENANLNASATRLLLWNRFKDQIPTWVFLTAAPNPVGIGQPFNFVMFNPQVPQGALIPNDVRYEYTIDVVKPNGNKETLPSTGTFVSDSTGSQFTTYTPDQTGNYSFTVKFHELFYRWYYDDSPGAVLTRAGANNTYTDNYGTTLKESTYTLIVTVQEEPVSLISLPLISPLPTEYWTRPIEGQNTNWYQVASNWLSGPYDRDNGGGENRYQANGIAPNSAHILWTRPTEDNGVVGGNDLSRPGNVFNAGSQYQPRFTNQIIMYGRLYYSPNVLSSGSSSLLDCVDLKTGKLLWEMDTGGANVAGLLGVSTTANMPQFGYYYSQDDPNEHGIQNPGWLFSANYAIGYQPQRGIPYLNITNVPSPASPFFGGGTPGVVSTFEAPGPSGEILRYVLHTNGTSGSSVYYLGQWNSSKVIPMIGAGSNPSSAQINAGTPNRYDWNITFPISFTTTPTIRAALTGEILFGSNGSWPTGTSGPNYAYPDEVTVWAINLNASKGTVGQLLYKTNIDVDDASTNQNIMFERATAAEGVFVAIEVPSCKFIGYSMYTGAELWRTDAQADTNAYGYFTWPSLISATQTKMAYGLLYTGGYTGMVSAYNLTNGNLEWRQVYPSGGEKIQNYVQMLGLICDGKIYVGTHEHSADTPLYKGEHLHCLNATTGDEIWSMSGWAYPMTFATADGVLIYWNNYDAQIYAIGKGPTSTMVQAPNVAAAFNTPVVITGSVMDISAGTQQDEQAARFPNGVPAVSEASMPEWMEYVYQQKAKPTNATGVEVTLSVIDSNNNCREIGKATSDASGFFHYTWTPDIPGDFTVIATFAGSEGYWPSSAEAAFTVMNEPQPTAAPTPTPISAAEQYFIPMSIAIIIAIAVVGAVIVVLMLRRRP